MDTFQLRALLLAFLVFAPLERVLAMHRGQRFFRRFWPQDLAFYALLNALLIRVGIGGIIGAAVAIGIWAIPGAVQATLAALPLPVQVPLVILVSDLGFYAVHRLFHTVPRLWKFHAIHHSIEELDWLAAYRVHPVDQILTKGASLAPIFALGFDTGAIAVSALIYQWQSLLVHSNVKIGFGPLRWVMVSPQFHHWHHANEPEAIDKNFAGQLAFLDVLFGTVHLPGRAVPSRYGTHDPVPPGYAAQLLFPLGTRRK